jgi:predicted DsbA family dithiol-disulfide isomerase
MKYRVREDVEEAERIGVKATPTLVINGRLIEGLPSPERLVSLLAVAKQQTAKQ